jgi:hypothetical protein
MLMIISTQINKKNAQLSKKKGDCYIIIYIFKPAKSNNYVRYACYIHNNNLIWLINDYCAGKSKKIIRGNRLNNITKNKLLNSFVNAINPYMLMCNPTTTNFENIFVHGCC